METRQQPDSQPRSKWRNLTDNELLEASFDTFDPEALPDIVLDLPDDYLESTLETQYDTTTTTGVKVRCIHCGWPNHFHGFVFKTPRGQRILVGHKCGEEIYGVQFIQRKNEFDAARRRRDALSARQYAIENGNRILSACANLSNHPAVTLFRQTRSAWTRNFPALGRKVLDACVRGGSLFVDVPVRNFKAEEARDERLQREAERQQELTKTAKSKLRQEIARVRGKPIYRHESQMIGSVEGLAFFLTNSPGPHEAIPNCVSRIQASWTVLSRRFLTCASAD